MARNPGKYVELQDGRKGIVRNKEQHIAFAGRVLVNIVDDKFQPIMNDQEKPIRVFKMPNELKTIGFID